MGKKLFTILRSEILFIRAVVGFWKVVRPLNAVVVDRVLKARVRGEHERGYVPFSLGGFGDLPHESFVIKDD